MGGRLFSGCSRSAFWAQAIPEDRELGADAAAAARSAALLNVPFDSRLLQGYHLSYNAPVKIARRCHPQNLPQWYFDSLARLLYFISLLTLYFHFDFFCPFREKSCLGSSACCASARGGGGRAGRCSRSLGTRQTGTAAAAAWRSARLRRGDMARRRATAPGCGSQLSWL